MIINRAPWSVSFARGRTFERACERLAACERVDNREVVRECTDVCELVRRCDVRAGWVWAAGADPSADCIARVARLL